MRPILAALLTSLALPAFAFDPAHMTDAERKAFQAEVRAYLLENPQVIADAVKVLDDQKNLAAIEADKALVKTYSSALFDAPSAWVGGNPDGDITVVEFIDYRCGYCRKAHAEVAELVKSDGNIRFIVKDYPILGDESIVAARFAIAVRQLAGDAAYKAAHDALITLPGEMDNTSLSRLATSLGLDAATVSAHMGAPEVTAVLEENHNLGVQMQINGTPTFVIQGEMLRGYAPLDGMRQIVADERAG